TSRTGSSGGWCRGEVGAGASPAGRAAHDRRGAVRDSRGAVGYRVASPGGSPWYRRSGSRPVVGRFQDHRTKEADMRNRTRWNVGALAFVAGLGLGVVAPASAQEPTQPPREGHRMEHRRPDPQQMIEHRVKML